MSSPEYRKNCPFAHQKCGECEVCPHYNPPLVDFDMAMAADPGDASAPEKCEKVEESPIFTKKMAKRMAKALDRIEKHEKELSGFVEAIREFEQAIAIVSHAVMDLVEEAKEKNDGDQ